MMATHLFKLCQQHLHLPSAKKGLFMKVGLFGCGAYGMALSSIMIENNVRDVPIRNNVAVNQNIEQ